MKNIELLCKKFYFYRMFKQNKSLIINYTNQAIELRRQIHQNPELSFEEYDTAKLIMRKLDEMAVPYTSNVGGNGIVATIKSGNFEKKIIALRADFDALPIQEETGLDFESRNSGVMHACGHDIHSSSLLAVAGVLNELKNEWEGTIHFVFQHAEELLPGGAKQMLDANLFGDLQPEYVIAQHVDPDLKVGEFGFKSDKYMASNDEIYLTINGKGGHGAMPHKFDDTVLAASQIINSLQQISSRLVPAATPMVLSFGKFIANGATNIIPNKVIIEGTFRTFDEKWRLEGHSHIERIAKSTAKAYGTECEVEIRKGYPVVVNNKDLYEMARKITIDGWGEEQVKELDYRMTSEDFAYFSNRYKSLFYRLGVGHKNESKNFPLHSSKFNPDESALEHSIRFMTELAINSIRV